MPEVYSDIFPTCSPPCGGEAEATCTYTIVNLKTESKLYFIFNFYPCQLLPDLDSNQDERFQRALSYH